MLSVPTRMLARAHMPAPAREPFGTVIATTAAHCAANAFDYAATLWLGVFGAGGAVTLAAHGRNRLRSFMPVVVPPQVASCGAGRSAPDGGASGAPLTLRPIGDQRTVDGSPAARFLAELIALLERPLGLLLSPQEHADVRAA